MGHVHRSKRSEQRPFTGAVVSERQNRAAHGGYCRHEECRCGATRRVNVNGQHVERGPWVSAED